MFDIHSISTKNKNLDFDLIKTNKDLPFVDTEEKNMLKTGSSRTDINVETLDTIELKALIKSLTEKQNLLTNQNLELIHQVEKFKFLLFEEKKNHEELNGLQNKEIRLLQNMCIKLTTDLNHYSTNLIKDQDIEIEETKEKKLKKKESCTSPYSLNLKHQHMGDDFQQKWLNDEETFKQNSECWRFEFKKIGLQPKNKIIQLNVELKNKLSSLLFIEDIRISSSESNF